VIRTKKIGRNDPCHCGSGKKFKKCHGDPVQMDRVTRAVAAAHAELPKHEAREHQRVAQQGLGKPIISAEWQGHRVVAIGNKVHISPTAKTFPDFLVEYVGATLGREWANQELAKPEDVMHPVARWYRTDALHRRKYAGKPGEVFSAPEIGASRALLELGYNLYLLEHNAELRSRLIDRLKRQDQFLGALSEIRIAGMLVRAGFAIAFEDEDERTRTHCEYSVTRKLTGKTFSVEVKTRHWGGAYPNNDAAGRREIIKHVSRQVRNALEKQADHDRIVFVEMAMPDRGTQKVEPWWLGAAEDGVRDAERLLAERGIAAPPAIVVVVNHPHHAQLDATDSVVGMVLTGSGGSEFKGKTQGTLHEAVEFRRRNEDFLAFWKSVQEHRNIPTTFDGSNPHLAFGEHPPSFRIGSRYEVPGADGSPVSATLEDAVAMPAERKVTGIYRSDDGQRFLVQSPMTDAEVKAYEEHPDTFFGVIKPQRSANGPLDLFEFMFEVHGKQSKEELLKFAANTGFQDLDRLAGLSQADLATQICERMVEAVMAKAPNGGKEG
jgi:hypothetical protein